MDSSAPRAGSRLLRWLAPVLSFGLLALMIVRVSACEPGPLAQKAQHASPERALNVAAIAEDTAKPSLDAGVPSHGYSLQFLGATKAAPMVVGDVLAPPAEMPASEPAVQENAL